MVNGLISRHEDCRYIYMSARFAILLNAFATITHESIKEHRIYYLMAFMTLMGWTVCTYRRRRSYAEGRNI